jgi:response regulator RpfG family c-di-GMP phosphodiesterase
MPHRILLVDDEEIVLKGWVKALRPTGYRVFTAENETDAVKIAEDEPIDVVVVDYILGKVTGVEVLNAIRKKRPLVRSILISGQIDEQLNEDSIRSLIRDKVEVDRYVHKPVRNKDLRGAISALLTNKDVEWQTWAKKVQSARESKLENGTDAATRLNQHLKK